MFLPPEPWPLPLRVIVLAAQRPGAVDPLAERFGVSHKCLVPIAGRPLITHVIALLQGHERVGEIVVSIETPAFAAIAGALPPPRADGPAVRCATAWDTITDSVAAAAAGHEGPLLITTADNVLLAHESIDAVLDGLKSSDAVVAMTTREAVFAAHPAGQQRFYEFRCGAYSNCNLYGLASAEALAAAEAFRSGGRFAKNAWRIVRAFGPVNLLLLRLKLVTLRGGLARVSRRLGVRIAPVVLADGTQAIDVDNDRTHAVAEALLRAAARRGNNPAIPPVRLAGQSSRHGQVAEHQRAVSARDRPEKLAASGLPVDRLALSRHRDDGF